MLLIQICPKKQIGVDSVNKRSYTNSIVRKLEQKMQNVSLHRNCKSIAQVGGFMPSSWLAINSLSYDRTPELTLGSTEMLV
jgi:hypothetical protein